MAELTKSDLIADLARDIVAEIAPQELPMFRAQSTAYFKDPEKALRAQEGKDEILGFGNGTAAAFVTPAVLTVATLVVEFVVVAVKESVKDEAKALIGETVQGVFKKLRPAKKEEGQEEPLTLTHEQLKQIRELVFAQATRMRLPGRKAGLLADSITGRLASAPL